MPRNVDPSEIGTGPGTGGGAQSSSPNEIPALVEHLATDAGAHPASAIEVDAIPSVFDGTNVNSVLDELSALVPATLPGLGVLSASLGTLTVPDWGVLKLRDGSIIDHEEVSSSSTAGEIYPLFYRVPGLADDADKGFSLLGDDPSTDPIFNVEDGGYAGGGAGLAHAGAFTRDVGGTPTVFVTHRVLDSSTLDVVVSGAIGQADRGILALIHWEPGETLAAITTSGEMLARCPAAILLGAGANSPTGCDGVTSGPGIDSGLAFYGVNDDPTSFPGKATGQYNLEEIHTAVRFDLSGPLPAPFNVADPDAGKVRLGTDPGAGAAFVVAGGIPTLGGTTNATGGGNDDNFFAYRLPYLSSYDETTGLRFTPDAEKDRYFAQPSVSASVTLITGGDYPGFDTDYWAYQLARYRHQFTLPFAGGLSDVGGYALVHFRTEGAFESFVRDGVVPASDDIYSVEVFDYSDIETLDNIGDLVPNEASDEYHSFRSSVAVDDQATLAPTLSAASFDYTTVLDESIWISGVQYLNPRSQAGVNFEFTDLSFLFENDAGSALGEAGFWENTYLTHDAENPVFLDDRDRVANRCPVAVHVGVFSAESGSFALAGTPNGYDARERFELNFKALDPSGSPWGVPTAPVPADFAGFDMTAVGASLTLQGDLESPKFSVDANPRILVRRPGRSATTDLVATFEIPPSDAKTILYHSSGFSGSSAPSYGNHEDSTVIITTTGVGAGTLDASDFSTGFTITVTQQSTAVLPEITEVVCGDASTLSLGVGSFFQIQSAASVTPYHVWYNVNGGSVDPGATANGIEVAVLSTDPPALVASATRAAIFQQAGVDFLTTKPWSGVYQPVDSLFTDTKDVEERFLDESYRLTFPGAGSVVGATNLPVLDPSITSGLAGPGLIVPPFPLDFPVRTYAVGSEEFQRISFVGTGSHRTTISSGLAVIAQVGGLPDRDPPLSDGVTSIQPSAGRCFYPNTDFSSGHRPSAVDGDLTVAQPDYSAISGGPAIYVRAFDVGFSRQGLENVVGESEFILRLRGISLEDFTFAGVGPGSTGMTVLVKIPGMTTWLDAGRLDGEGPDKQSLTEDGAGCLMLNAAETFDGIDEEGVIFAQTRLNMAPGTFSLNSQGEIPVLVRIEIKDTIAGRALNFEQGGATSSNTFPRGLIGVSVIRQSQAFDITAYAARRFDSGFEDVAALDTGTITVFES